METCKVCRHSKSDHTGTNSGYSGTNTECRHDYERFIEKAKEQCLCREFRPHTKVKAKSNGSG